MHLHTSLFTRFGEISHPHRYLVVSKKKPKSSLNLEREEHGLHPTLSLLALTAFFDSSEDRQDSTDTLVLSLGPLGRMVASRETGKAALEVETLEQGPSTQR